MRVRRWEFGVDQLPAAVQRVADRQEMPLSSPDFGVGVGVMVQRMPFQDSASGWSRTLGPR
jgi:hypothetical protein